MAKQTINIGTTPNSRNGDPLRTAFNKVNENFVELYAAVTVVPSNTAKIFKFVATFLVDGTLSTIGALPPGWTATVTGNIVTINHNVGTQPLVLSYWGYILSTGEYKLTYPVNEYQVVLLPGLDYSFKLTLDSSITGVDKSQHAIITVLF